MARLYIMYGLPFSGKTTLARKISEYTGAKLIGFDNLWKEKKKELPEDKVEEWKLIREVAQKKIQKELSEGNSVIYDDINVRYEHRKRLRNTAKKAGADSIIVYVNTPLDEIFKRKSENKINQKRHGVEDENFKKALEQFEPPQESEKVIEYTPQINLDSWLKLNF